MIYVSVGKMPIGFDRLVEAADEMARDIGDDVFIQSGSSPYRPMNAQYKDFVTFPEAEELQARASVIVSHAGIGTIIGALRSGTPIVIVPRREKYKEHFTDHQMEIADALRERRGVMVVEDVRELPGAVRRLMGMKGLMDGKSGR